MMLYSKLKNKVNSEDNDKVKSISQVFVGKKHNRDQNNDKNI